MQENNNIYVSSRGLLKSCEYFSLTPYSSTRQLYNYPQLKTIKNIKNTSIYICNSAIPHFINVMLPQIDFSFTLVSGDSDDIIPQEVLNNTEYNKLLNDNRVIHWFCQNMTLDHNKITRIPIGLDYHTLSQRPLWGPISNCHDQEKMLIMIKEKSVPFWNRNVKCYGNFQFNIQSKLGYDRKDAFKKINKNLMYYEEKLVSRLITWNKQKDFAFVICPHGGGLDCHRNWEALCLGCIPIVKTSKIDNLYKNLPVLIIKDWNIIDNNLLNNTINDFKKKFENNEFNMEKLKLSYWTNLINSYK
tara:strand:+ start:5063 stop:5968 length:906 start_codon:yes stop_codon:yes gene_type:complete